MSNTPKLLKVDVAVTGSEGALREAVQALQQGHLVILPTETVYGLAAHPGVPRAMERLYRAKGRPADKPVALLAADVAEVRRGTARWSPAIQALTERYWPGPLTLVLPTSQRPIGFRIPDHPVTLRLLDLLGSPLAVTSANRSDESPARTAQEAVEALGPWVSVALDAGPTRGGVPSTVVQWTDDRFEILREGAIPSGEILRVVEETG